MGERESAIKGNSKKDRFVVKAKRLAKKREWDRKKFDADQWKEGCSAFERVERKTADQRTKRTNASCVAF